MKLVTIAGFLCLGALAMAQEVHFDYDRSANFGSYKTFQWQTKAPGQASNQLMDQNIKQAIQEQLILKGLMPVPSGGDLSVNYQVAIEQEKQFDGYGYGPRWSGGRVNTSTIEVGTLVVQLVDPARGQLVWRGDVSKTLDIKKDPAKNYKNLQKALGKLFKNYPPGPESK